MDDTIQIRCSRCKNKFRDRAKKIIVGYSRQCPQCEVLIFFEDSSPKEEVQEALIAAQRLRKALVLHDEQVQFERRSSYATSANPDDPNRPERRGRS